MSEPQAGFVLQAKVCFERCVRAFVNDRGWKTFLSSAIIALLVGLVMGEGTFVNYADTKNGSFALVSACIWIGIFNSIRTICRERDIVRREYRTGLNLRAYILAQGLLKTISAATISRWGLDAICANAHVNNMFDSFYAFGTEGQVSTVENLLVLWLTLLAFSVIYAMLSVFAISFVDKR